MLARPPGLPARLILRELMMAILRDDPPRSPRRAGRSRPSSSASCADVSKASRGALPVARDLACPPGGGASRGLLRARSPSSAWGPGARPIAVLPLSQPLLGQGDRYFSDGMNEEILTALSGVEDLRVAARTSSLRSAGGDEMFGRRSRAGRLDRPGGQRSPGREPTARRRPARRRLQRYQLWSEVTNARWRTSSRCRDEIASAIAATARGAPARRRVRRDAVTPGTRDIEAYKLYLEGRYPLRQADSGEGRSALQRGAVARDPRYAAAYTGLSDAYCSLGFTAASTRARPGPSRAAGEVAQNLSRIPRTSGSRSESSSLLRLETGAQDRFLRRAAAARRRSGEPWFCWLGLGWGLRGFMDEGLEMTRRAASLANAIPPTPEPRWGGRSWAPRARPRPSGSSATPSIWIPRRRSRTGHSGWRCCGRGRRRTPSDTSNAPFELTERRQTLLRPSSRRRLGRRSWGGCRPSRREIAVGRAGACSCPPCIGLLAAKRGRRTDAAHVPRAESRGAQCPLLGSHLYFPFFDDLRESRVGRPSSAESSKTMPTRTPEEGSVTCPTALAWVLCSIPPGERGLG